jgi:hypothetical protein
MSVGNIHLHALPFAWPVLWPMLERAARRARPPIPEAEVRRTVESGHAQLWAILENGHPIAAVTTQITLDPEKRCRVWLVGGSRMTEWVGDFLGKVEPWARSYGCKAIWGTQSRAAWVRIGRLLGCEPIEPFEGIPAWGKRI